MFGLIAAMESAETTTADADEVAQVQSQADSTAEASATEDEGGVVSSEIGDAEETLDAAEELNEYSDVAEEAVASGDGLSKDAAAMATIAVERIHEKLFGTREQSIVLAKEKFGSSNSRLDATIAVVEGIKETISRIWKAIKSFAARLWDRIRGFFAKLFNSAKMTGKSITNMRDRIHKLDSNLVMRDKKLKNESLAKSISVKKKANSSTWQECAKNAAALLNTAEAATDARVESTKYLMELAKSTAPNASQIEGFVKNHGGLITRFVGQVGTVLGTVTAITASKNGKLNAKAQTATSYFGPFVDSKILEISVYGGGGAAGALSSLSVAFTPDDDKNVATEVDALERTDMLKMLDVCEKVNDAISDFQRVEKNVKAITNSIENVADTIVKNFGEAMEESGANTGARAAMRDAQKATKETFAVINAFTTVAPTIMLRTVQSGVNYVSASLANFKGKK